MVDLSKLPIDMQKRLQTWRENILPVPLADLLPRRLPSNPNTKPTHIGCGGDMKDNRDCDAWNREFNNNPIYRGYR